MSPMYEHSWRFEEEKWKRPKWALVSIMHDVIASNCLTCCYPSIYPVKRTGFVHTLHKRA